MGLVSFFVTVYVLETLIFEIHLVPYKHVIFKHRTTKFWNFILKIW